jgi:hypothetical protein
VITIRPWLHIGGFKDAQDREQLISKGICAVLTLHGPVDHDGIETLHMPIADGVMLKPSTISKGVEFLLDHKERDHGVMTACFFGTSRSVTFAVAALKEAENLQLEEALHEVVALHPEASPHQKLWATIVKYYGEPVMYDRVADALIKLKASSEKQIRSRGRS